MTFRVFDSVDSAEWQRVAESCGYATFFHTPLWTELFSRTYPGSRAVTRKFLFPDGRSAIFPLLERRKLLGTCRIRQSTGAGCYGGWISTDPITPEEADAITRWMLRHGGTLVWRLNPFQPEAAAAAPHAARSDSTEAIDLRAFPDADALFHNYRHSTRKQVNKGARAGFRVSEAEGWGEWERYLEIYEALLHHWGDQATSAYPPALFRNLFAASSPAVKLWLVRLEDRILGGNLNFYHGRHCVEWHAAYDREFFASGVRDFTVHQIVSHAQAGGYHYYDFNPSGGHEGARRFKQTFGTTSLPCDVIHQRRGLYRLQGVRGAHQRLRQFARTRSGQAPESA